MSGDNREGRLPPIRKRLGQHFLTDTRTLDRIADVLEITADDTVIEIGPGRGALTDRLAARAGRLITIEIDKLLVPVLRARYADRPHVQVIESDVLHLALGEVAGGRYLLAGNVPYYITTPIIFHALTRPRPERAVFLVQREVADRAVAAPGSKEYGALSVNLQALATVTPRGVVKPSAFNPPPSVDSAILHIVPRADPVIAEGEEAAFRKLVIASFGLRRKQLRRVVRTVRGLSAPEADAALLAAGIDPEARPETLSAAQFAALLRALPAALTDAG
ncbi:MAG: ribosomal RNA small subunit methyltransferase A [Gemmatimonadaceae bacterium]|nr:ribosomal RNA small subunit methyltransferase A [Gemmatimonadaceae bacterium]